MPKNRPASNRLSLSELDAASEYSTALDEFVRADCAIDVVDERPWVVSRTYTNVTQKDIAIQGDACVVLIRDLATPDRNWDVVDGRPPGAVPLTSEHGSLLFEAESLTHRFAEALKLQDVEDALDVIFNAVDSALLAGRFRECDRALASECVDAWPTDLLIGLLSITLAGSHELPARAAFFERARRVVIERGDDTPGLLDGLE